VKQRRWKRVCLILWVSACLPIAQPRPWIIHLPSFTFLPESCLLFVLVCNPFGTDTTKSIKIHLGLFNSTVNSKQLDWWRNRNRLPACSCGRDSCVGGQSIGSSEGNNTICIWEQMINISPFHNNKRINQYYIILSFFRQTAVD
jgi:hypothetical protein